MELDDLRDEFDWMFEFQSRMAERISGDADVHNLVDYVGKLESENAELRELVRTACKIADSLCELAPSCAKCACPDTTGGNCMLTQIERKLFELGAEV